MSSLCQWFCTCRCIGKRNKDFLNANAKAPICKNTMATGGDGRTGCVTNQPSNGMGLLLSKPTYTCDICGQEGLNEDDMKTHVLLEHVEGEISCPFCDLEGTTVEEMNLHVNSQHLDFSTPYKEKSEDLITSVRETSQKNFEDKVNKEKDSLKNLNDDSQNKMNNTSLSNSKQELNLLNSQKQSKSTNNEKVSSSKESIQSYMPLQEVRNASEVSMDTASSCQSNNTSTSSSPESEISLGNRETSSENNNSSSYEASSSSSTTPDDPKSSQQVIIREIKINVIKDSPKKVVSSDDVDLKMGFDGEEQSRKRAKLYLHVPQPHSPRRQISSDAPTTRAPSLLDSHASTAELHRFGQLSSPKFPSHHGLVGMGALVETDGTDDTPEDSDSDIFTCPLCSWNTRSPGAIVRHVNTDHLDVISPSAHPQRSAGPIATDTENNVLSAKAGTSSPQFACPICNLDAKTGSILELHVNSEHAELLSPAKPLQPQVSDYLHSLLVPPSKPLTILRCHICNLLLLFTVKVKLEITCTNLFLPVLRD